MLLGSANVQLALQCRASFKYYLHYDYHGLLHHSNALGAAQLFWYHCEGENWRSGEDKTGGV